MFLRTKERSVVCFVLGIVFGYQLAANNFNTPRSVAPSYERLANETDDVYATVGDVDGDGGSELERARSSVENGTRVIRFNDFKHHRDDDTVARALYESVRVLCWVMTSSGGVRKRAIHVRETWGRRCNALLFVSDADDPDLPAVGLPGVRPGRVHLTSKTMRAFDYVHRRHLADADWFLKADDDTYVIVENLRHLLSAHSPEEPVYFGQHFRPHARQGYFSGGAGYVLSRAALARYGSRDLNACSLDDGAEDVELGRCMEAVGVRAGNSRDRLNRSRFHSLSVRDHIRGNYPDWYRRYDGYSDRQGIEAVSDYPVSFHYVTPADMYVMEYFTYHASVYGLLRGLQQLNPEHSTTTQRAPVTEPTR